MVYQNDHRERLGYASTYAYEARQQGEKINIRTEAGEHQATGCEKDGKRNGGRATTHCVYYFRHERAYGH